MQNMEQVWAVRNVTSSVYEGGIRDCVSGGPGPY